MTDSNLIHNFHTFLINSWPQISHVLDQLDWDDSPYFLDWWIQANWELLVEQQALVKSESLIPYGYGQSSGNRYTNKTANSTHVVKCKRKGQSDYQYKFLYFLTKVKGYAKIAPPFDLANIEDTSDGTMLTVPYVKLEFSIEKIP